MGNQPTNSDKAWNIFFFVFELAGWIFIVLLIPGILWLTSGVTIELLKFVDKGVNWLFAVPLGIRIPISVVIGFAIFLWRLKNKQTKFL